MTVLVGTIQHRRDTAANWVIANPILLDHEFGYESDTGNVKKGNGTLHWNDLTYHHDPYLMFVEGNLTDLENDYIVFKPTAELKSNKVTSLNTPDNISYPTTQAVKSGLDTKQDSLGFTPENSASKGQANGYVPLNSSSVIPQQYLPSYVDDVLEYVNLSGFPATGETGKIYIALDTSKQYRWSGSAYIQITNGLIASTDDLPEGTTNKYSTNSRVLNYVLTGLSAAASRVLPASTDSIITAWGKVLKYLTDLGTAAFKNVGTGSNDVAQGDLVIYKSNNLSDVASAGTSRLNLNIPILLRARAVATSNIASLSGATTQDGVTVSAGQNIFLAGQTTASQNGPWTVQTGAWTRPADYASGSTVSSMIILVAGGNDYKGTIWYMTNMTAVVDTDATTWEIESSHFIIPMNNGAISPSDNTSYYFGMTLLPPTTVANNHVFKVGYKFTIVGAFIQTSLNTIQGSNEDSTMKIYNLTTGVSSTICTFKTNAVPSTSAVSANVTGLNITVGANDQICGQWDTPNWATNPTTLRPSLFLICKRA